MYSQSSQNTPAARPTAKGIFASSPAQGDVAIDAVTEMIAEGLIAGKSHSQIATAILHRYPSLNADSVAEIIRRLATLQQTAASQSSQSSAAPIAGANQSGAFATTDKIYQDMGARYQVAWSVDGMQALARDMQSVNLVRIQKVEVIAKQKSEQSPFDDFWDTFYNARPRFLLFKMMWQTARLGLRLPPRLVRMGYRRWKEGPAQPVPTTAEPTPVIHPTAEQAAAAIEVNPETHDPSDGPVLAGFVGEKLAQPAGEKSPRKPLFDRELWKQRGTTAWNRVRQIKIPTKAELQAKGKAAWDWVRSLRMPRRITPSPELRAATWRVVSKTTSVIGTVISTVWMFGFRRLPESWQAKLGKAGEQLRKEFAEIAGYWQKKEEPQPVAPTARRPRDSKSAARPSPLAKRRNSASKERPRPRRVTQSEEAVQAAIDAALDMDDDPSTNPPPSEQPPTPQ